MTATHRSKLFAAPSVNFPWGRVQADAYPVTLKVDAGPFTSQQLTALVATRPAVLSAAGSMLRATIAVASTEPFRLPDGFVAQDWQLQIETTAGVQGIVLASTVKETA